MNLDPTIAYLDIFFNEHIDYYVRMMKDAGSKVKPEAYKGQHEAIEMILNIVHGIQHEFTDMRIPQAYSSPEELHGRFIAYLQMARAQADQAQALSAALGAEWPSEIEYANEISNQVADAIKYALTLSNLHPVPRTTMEKLLHIASALPKVAKQLTRRRQDKKVPRPTININDEYDVQDLLHSLLLIEFSDIRNEEWTPSFAGASKRIDFLLHDEKIVIEVKKVRSNQTQSDVVNDLVVDITTYRSHPKADHLVCVVWDVTNILSNAVALKKDLEDSSNNFVTVIVLN